MEWMSLLDIAERKTTSVWLIFNTRILKQRILTLALRIFFLSLVSKYFIFTPCPTFSFPFRLSSVYLHITASFSSACSMFREFHCNCLLSGDFFLNQIPYLPHWISQWALVWKFTNKRIFVSFIFFKLNVNCPELDTEILWFVLHTFWVLK